MNTSETISEVSAAFVLAQSEFDGISKDSTNPFFNSRYADINNVLDMVLPVLAKHGLAVMQLPAPTTKGVRLQTVLLHTSGEWIADECLDIVAPKDDPQGYGQAITYGRRYSLLSVLGLRTEDDDANSSVAAMSKVEQARLAARSKA